jgi:hypothetical protein
VTKEEMIIETARSTMEHGVSSPRRTDLIWKIRSFMVAFGLEDRSPGELLDSLKAHGLEVDHIRDRVGSSREGS